VPRPINRKEGKKKRNVKGYKEPLKKNRSPSGGTAQLEWTVGTVVKKTGGLRSCRESRRGGGVEEGGLAASSAKKENVCSRTKRGGGERLKNSAVAGMEDKKGGPGGWFFVNGSKRRTEGKVKENGEPLSLAFKKEERKVHFAGSTFEAQSTKVPVFSKKGERREKTRKGVSVIKQKANLEQGAKLQRTKA